MNTLTPTQLAELRASGIGDDVIPRAKLFSCSDPKWLNKAGIAVTKAWTPEYLPALVYPYGEPGKPSPKLYAVKPAKPMPLGRERDGKESKPAKYLRTRKTLYCYLPPSILERPAILDDKSTALLVTEGEKKALSAESHGLTCIGLAGVHTWGRGAGKNKPTPHMSGWGAKDLNGVKRLFEPLTRAAAVGRDIFVVFDSDAAENLITVRPAENDLARVLTKAGATVYIVRLPAGADDAKVGLDDFLVAHGANAFRRLMHDAREQGPACTPEEAAYHRRPEVVVSTNRQFTVDAALAALKDHPRIFQRGGQLARITRELGTPPKRIAIAPDAPRIGLLPKSILGVELTDRASVVQPKGDNLIPCQPPPWLLDAISDLGQWSGFSHLTSVIEQPVLRADGTLVTAPGYDTATGLYYEPAGDTWQLPEQLTRDDAIRARRELEAVVADFPFRGPEHIAAWAAAILTAVARYSFDGPSPLFLFDASTAGSGKTLLALIASLIASGRLPAKCQLSQQDDEQRKLITTLAIEGTRIVLFDNLIHELGGAAICDALTATRWSDRLLGENRTYSGPLLATWYLTGNNIRLGDDMHRRICHIRLEPKVDRPEERTAFAHPDLLVWVRAEQRKLLNAALVILRAYALADRPSVELVPWGGYEAWSAAVRAPAVWAGFADPASTRKELVSTSCLNDAAALRLVHGWYYLTVVARVGPCPAGRALQRIYPDAGPHAPDTDRDPFPKLRAAIEELAPGHGGERISAKSLGRLLAKYRGRVFDGLALESNLLSGETLWKTIGSPSNGRSDALKRAIEAQAQLKGFPACES